MNVRRLFDPDSIAAIGASATRGKPGSGATKNVADFEGPVNPIGEGEDG